MSELLPAGLDDAFLTAASELGMCSAAWLFAREAEAVSREHLAALRDTLGRAFPVLDTVVAARLEGAEAPSPSPAALDALKGFKRVVIVGLEARFVDALAARGGSGPKLALLTETQLPTDWGRVLSNYPGAVEAVDLASFQRWAGPASALLTFAYGATGASTHVLPTWLRATGPDVRTQFGALAAWDVLQRPMYVYPRWLVEVAADGFTHWLS